MIFPDKIIKQLEAVIPRQVWYREYYLKSRHWKKFKRQVKERRENKCQRCYRKPSPGALSPIIDVHHLNYNCLWHETPADVILLCRECHKKAHGK